MASGLLCCMCQCMLCYHCGVVITSLLPPLPSAMLNSAHLIQQHLQTETQICLRPKTMSHAQLITGNIHINLITSGNQQVCKRNSRPAVAGTNLNMRRTQSLLAWICNRLYHCMHTGCRQQNSVGPLPRGVHFASAPASEMGRAVGQLVCPHGTAFRVPSWHQRIPHPSTHAGRALHVLS